MSTDSKRPIFTEAQADILARLVAQLHLDILRATNAVRFDLNMPTLKQLPYHKPRLRIAAPTRPWQP